MSTFNQQLRYLKRNEPSLYESISKAYRKCLMESNLAPQTPPTNNEAAKTEPEKTEINQTNTKGVNNLMDKVHSMVGVNENKKEGTEIFDNKGDDIETVQPDPQQQAELFGQTPPPAETGDTGFPEATQPMESPTADTDGLGLDNMFGDDDTTAEPEQPVEETPVEEPVAEEPVAEEPPAEEPAPEEDSGDGLDLDNLF